MKIFSISQLSLVAAVFFLNASLSHAAVDNTTVAGAVPYEVGQGWVSHHFDESAQERWFVFEEQAGRSYCIEAAQGSASYYSLNISLSLYASGAETTPLLSNNNDAEGSAPISKDTRICYASSLQNINDKAARPIKINVPAEYGDEKNGYVRLRIVETTYIAQHFNTYYIRETTYPYYISSGNSTFRFTNNSLRPVKISFFSVKHGIFAKEVIINRVTYGPQNVNITPLLSTGSYSGAIHIMHDGPPHIFSDAYIGVITSGPYAESTSNTYPVTPVY